MAKKTKTKKTEHPSSIGSEVILVNAQFIRDLSFEAPKMPEILGYMQKNQPDINVNVNVSTKKFEETVFEVDLNVDAKAMVGKEVGFIIELEYCGLFTLNCPPEAIQPLVLIECPRLIFPFARAVLAQVTRDAGFPPLMLGSVDFAGMFKQEMERHDTINNNNAIDNIIS